MTGPPENGRRPELPDALYEAGFPVDLLTEEQREVLSGLTPEELAVLLDVKGRIGRRGAGGPGARRDHAAAPCSDRRPVTDHRYGPGAGFTAAGPVHSRGARPVNPPHTP